MQDHRGDPAGLSQLGEVWSLISSRPFARVGYKGGDDLGFAQPWTLQGWREAGSVSLLRAPGFGAAR